MTIGLREKIVDACFSVLVEMAKFLQAAGISYIEFEETARKAFVKSASESFGLRGRLANASRVAAVTGLPRKEIGLIRRQLENLHYSSSTRLSPPGDVLTGWYTDQKYLDDTGTPIPLSLSGGSPSFADLVDDYARDIPPNNILKELRRIGAVEGEHEIRPLRRDVVPLEMEEKLVEAITFSLRGLCSTIAHNTCRDIETSARIERFVFSPPLSPDKMLATRCDLEPTITGFAESIDDQFSSIQMEEGQNEAPGSENKRVAVGVYYVELP